MASAIHFQKNSNMELVNNLRDNGYIRHHVIYDIMKLVDRADFITNPDRNFIDWMVRFKLNNETKGSPIKDAIVLGLMTDKLREGNRALDVGMGTGYLTVCMARGVGETGLVVGLDCQPKCIDRAMQIIRNHYPDLLETQQIELIAGDGRYGCVTDMLYDIINVNVADTRVPVELLRQLNHGGRLIMPIIEDGKQILTVFTKSKSGKHVTISRRMPVQYGVMSSFYWKGKTQKPILDYNVTARTENAKKIQESIQEYKKTVSEVTDEKMRALTENIKIMLEQLNRSSQLEEVTTSWINPKSDIIQETAKESTIMEMKEITEQNWVELERKVQEMKIASLFCTEGTTKLDNKKNAASYQPVDKEYSMYINELNALETRIKAFKMDLHLASFVLNEIKEESYVEYKHVYRVAPAPQRETMNNTLLHRFSYNAQVQE